MSYIDSLVNQNIKGNGLQSGGATKRGIQDDVFRSKENFHYLRKNINQILSHEYNHPIIVDPQLLEATIRFFSHNMEPQTTCSLNKRVIAKIRIMMRDDQHDIQIANEWEDEQFDVLSRNEDSSYNPIPVPIRTEEIHPIQYVEM